MQNYREGNIYIYIYIYYKNDTRTLQCQVTEKVYGILAIPIVNVRSAFKFVDLKRSIDLIIQSSLF